ncbi:MAG: nitrogen fixation protein NifX [Anaeromyxobacteraceae bacterium]
MRVAFTSLDGVNVDQHFGQVSVFHVWDVGPTEARFVEHVSAVVAADDEEDRTTARATAVAGCAIVYTVQIGGPAAAKLVARRILPIKTGVEVAISELVSKLQEVMRGKPPPWLRKAMGGAADLAEET